MKRTIIRTAVAVALKIRSLLGRDDNDCAPSSDYDAKIMKLCQLVQADPTFDADGEHTPEGEAWEELLDQVAERGIDQVISEYESA